MSGARRTSIEIPGFSHRNPIPAASRIGQHLHSGALTGRDPRTGEMPQSLAAQCANVFAHVRALLDAAGGSTDDIIELRFWLSDPGDRGALNEQWMAMFPDPASRPARHVVAASLTDGALVHCSLVAILADT